MIEYTMKEVLNVTVSGPEAKTGAEFPKNIPLKHIQGNRDQRIKLNDSFSEDADNRGLPPINMYGAFRALAQLMHSRLEPKKLSEEIMNVYTEMLQVDGMCMYQSNAEGGLEVLACNPLWSNMFSTLQEEDELDGQNILLHPAVYFNHPVVPPLQEQDQPVKAIPLTLGMRNYGWVVSLPLVSDGISVGAISLFSVHPQYFAPRANGNAPNGSRYDSIAVSECAHEERS